jgi:hypothetical protein
MNDQKNLKFKQTIYTKKISFKQELKYTRGSCYSLSLRKSSSPNKKKLRELCFIGMLSCILFDIIRGTRCRSHKGQYNFFTISVHAAIEVTRV